MEKQNTIRESIDFIERNLTEDMSLTHLAGRAYISKFHFHRMFRQLVGKRSCSISGSVDWQKRPGNLKRPG